MKKQIEESKDGCKKFICM